MEVDDHFAAASDSITWAREALGEFELIARDFSRSGVFRIIVERDERTGVNEQKLQLTTNLPKLLRRKLTEALVTTRHAFDQATYASKICLGQVAGKRVYFPWASSPADLQGRLKKLGIDTRMWDIFEGLEPYPESDVYSGGCTVKRTLATIANDKHTVGLAVHPRINRVKYPDVLTGKTELFEALAPNWDPVRNEAVLMRWKGEVKISGDYDVHLAILFKDRRLKEPVNAVLGTAALIDMAERLTVQLKERCASLH
jgi:hypothetical protein